MRNTCRIRKQQMKYNMWLVCKQCEHAHLSSSYLYSLRVQFKPWILLIHNAFGQYGVCAVVQDHAVYGVCLDALLTLTAQRCPSCLENILFGQIICHNPLSGLCFRLSVLREKVINHSILASNNHLLHNMLLANTVARLISCAWGCSTFTQRTMQGWNSIGTYNSGMKFHWYGSKHVHETCIHA